MLKRWPGKILLFGEYTVLNGSKAFATPYDLFYGEWSFNQEASIGREISRKVLFEFISQASESILDAKKLKDDYEKGLWFKSSIPHGYGLGSSGALIAAIFENYGKASGEVLDDMRLLASLEHYFHGSSSGIDPLVSLSQKPLLIHNFDQVQPLDNRSNLRGFFLLNTGHSRQTGPLVKIFKQKLADPEFSRGCSEVLVREVNSAIDLLLNNSNELQHHLWLISKFQLDYFSEMIPLHMKDFWAKGLNSGDYILKLCGAGGGGFLLGYSSKFKQSELKDLFSPFEILDIES